ncbi:MAG TPA: hypothetical protein VGO59_18025 [Verrucomicrobiae bacterium]|jgi:hypothetical protein
MPDFEVRIKTPVELEGAKQLAEYLERARGKAIALGQSTEELDGKLKTVNSAIAGAGEAAKKGAEGTGEFLEGHHGIHAMGHALNEAMPGLMQFTRFLTSGFTTAIGAAVLAFGYLTQKAEEFSKLLDSLDTGAGARGEWAEKLADNIRDAAVEESVFNERMRETIGRQEALSESTDRLIAAQKQQAADSKSVGDAQKELDLARLALAEKLGEVTPDQAVKIRLEIDDAAFKRQLESEKAAVQAELAARQQEFKANENRAPELGGAMDRAGAAALAAGNARDKNAAKLAQDKQDLEQLQEAQKKMNEGIGLGDFMPRWLEKFAQQGSPMDILKSGPDQIAAMIAQKQRAVSQEDGKGTALATAAALAKEQAEKAKSDYEDAAKLSDEILKTVNKLKADLAAATAKNGALENIHQQTGAVAAASADAPNEIARRDALLRRSMMPDRGAGETAAEQSQFNDLSAQAAEAIKNANLNLNHGGVGATGQTSARQLAGLVRTLLEFIKGHPALQSSARDDMQSEIDALRRDLRNSIASQNLNR